MITDKKQFQKLSQAGRLGNFLPAWKTVAALHASGYRGWLTIRSIVEDCPWFVTWIHSSKFHATFRRILKKSRMDADKFFFQSVPGPNAGRIFQFEAMRGTLGGMSNYLKLVYEISIKDIPLRGIRDRGIWVEGLAAQLILRRYLDPTSFDTLQELWDEHPDAIIEATEFSVPCGMFQKNLVVWEVRNY